MAEIEKIEKKRKKSDDMLFFLGIVGVLVLLFTFYIAPSGKGSSSNTKATSTTATSTSLKKSILDFFKIPKFKPLVQPVNTQNNQSNTNQNTNQTPQTSSQVEALKAGESVWKGKVRLETGSGTNEASSYKEYVVIQAGDVGASGVNITGWKLQNGRGDKYYQTNGSRTLYSSEYAFVPKGAKLFIPGGTNYYQPVILYQNQKAIVVTGSMLNSGTPQVQGFRVNKCSGYLENSPDYEFYPNLYTQCPVPSSEPGISTMELSCYRFIQSIGSCHTPTYPDITWVGDRVENGYVDNTPGLTSQCKDYLKVHYSYNACVSNHSADKDFYTNEWRLFMNRGVELWGVDRETFSLYDSAGKLVDQISLGY